MIQHTVSPVLNVKSPTAMYGDYIAEVFTPLSTTLSVL
jgi:hypothetical protein